MRDLLARVKKLIGAVIGGATGAGVAGVLALAGVDLPTQVDVGIAAILSWVGTFLAPPNASDADEPGAHALDNPRFRDNNPHIDTEG